MTLTSQECSYCSQEVEDDLAYHSYMARCEACGGVVFVCEDYVVSPEGTEVVHEACKQGVR